MENPFDETPGRLGWQKEAAVAFLVELTGDHPGARHRLGDVALIGRAADAQVRLNGRDVSRQHARICRDDAGAFHLEDLGSRHGVRLNGLPVQGTAQLVLGDRITVGAAVVLLFTQHDRVEEQLLHAQRMESLGRLAGGIAHDFNNLVGSALTNLAYLQSMPEGTSLQGAEVSQAIQDSTTALRRAADLTKQLLGFARRGRYSPLAVDLAPVVSDVLRLLQRPARHAEVSSDISSDLMAHGDAGQLHQVLMNVCLNALDAVQPAGGTVAIRGRVAIANDRTVMGLGPTREAEILIEVADTGTGMNEETRRSAFEPFFTTKAPGAGTGLGLASVYGIVMHHGGAVHLDSVLGEGTTVRILLPAGERSSGVVAHSTDAFDCAKATASVLVVDDEPLLRISTARYLRHLGYDVSEAEDGLSALTAAEMVRPDLVLLDMAMPGMDGPTTFAELRNLYDDLPIVLTTGAADEARAQALIADGGGLLLKPYEIGELAALLRTHLPQ